MCNYRNLKSLFLCISGWYGERRFCYIWCHDAVKEWGDCIIFIIFLIFYFIFVMASYCYANVLMFPVFCLHRFFCYSIYIFGFFDMLLYIFWLSFSVRSSCSYSSSKLISIASFKTVSCGMDGWQGNSFPTVIELLWLAFGGSLKKSFD